MINTLLTSALANVDLESEFHLNQNKTVAEVFGTPGALISTLLPNVFLFAGLIVLVMLVFGGFLLIAGGGDPKNIEKGTQAIRSAAIGFLLIFSSYWIIQIVQIVTGINIFNSKV